MTDTVDAHLEALMTDAGEAVRHLETALRELKNFRGLAEAALASGEVYIQELGEALRQVLSGIGTAAPGLLALQAELGNVVLEAQEEAREQERQGTGCPACGSDDYAALDLNGDGEPDYDGLKQCDDCGEEWQ